MVSYLVALDLTFSFPLLFGRFSVCLSLVYLETMGFFSAIGHCWQDTLVHYLFLNEMGSCRHVNELLLVL